MLAYVDRIEESNFVLIIEKEKKEFLIPCEDVKLAIGDYVEIFIENDSFFIVDKNIFLKLKTQKEINTLLIDLKRNSPKSKYKK